VARKPPKQTMVAFKVEAELADLLNQLPNKSEFIRKAIASQLGAACPLCNGKGVVSHALHDHFAPLIHANEVPACAACGNRFLLPAPSGELRPEDRARLGQFFKGGPLYCDACIRSTHPCGEGGWLIDGDGISDHMRLPLPSVNPPNRCQTREKEGRNKRPQSSQLAISPASIACNMARRLLRCCLARPM
jgi:hypothetical protein